MSREQLSSKANIAQVATQPTKLNKALLRQLPFNCCDIHGQFNNKNWVLSNELLKVELPP